MQVSSISPSTLGRYRPLCFLNKNELQYLAQNLEIEHAPAGQQLVHMGSQDPYTLYLLNGEISIHSHDGRRHTIKAGGTHSEEPVSHLLPHRFDVQAVTEVDYILVDHRLLDNVMARQFKDQRVECLQLTGELWSHPVFIDIYSQLENDNLRLPALPEAARRLQHLDDNDDVDKIATIVSADPATAVSLIRVANSPFYLGSRPVETVQQAVSLLGAAKAKHYALSYVMGNLFDSQSPVIAGQLKQIWSHSFEVAAIAHAIAQRHGEFNPDYAMLLGLIHDVGVLPILYYADKNHIDDIRRVDRLVAELHGPVGKVIMDRWGFAEDFVQITVEADRWDRDPTDEPDYCDIVLVAQLLSFFGKNLQADIPGMRHKTLPAISQVPAFRKLGLDGHSPEDSLALLLEARKVIGQTLKCLWESP